MARTLFFVEAALFAALLIVLPSLASDATAAFIAPAAISLIVPLASAMAVWPARQVLLALRAAFSPERPEPECASSYARILEAMTAFSKPAAALGLLFSLSAIYAHEPPAEGAQAWYLVGLYMAAYALLNGMLWSLLAEAVVRLSRPAHGALAVPAPGGTVEASREAALALAFGLTPRELEVALRISSGRSYKETAYELGISIRTVKAHMTSVYAKTGAASNVALALQMKGENTHCTKVQ
jgi:DNA-binding HTH domain-containing proteins